MKILLVGEYSSLHKSLKEGLMSLGHEVHLAATGDGWKKISGQDILFSSNGSKWQRIKEQYSFVDNLEKYDVVQLICPSSFSLLLNSFFVKKLKKKTKCLAMCAAGNDLYTYLNFKKGTLEYEPAKFDTSLNTRYTKSSIRGLISIINEKMVVNMVDIIIPSLYEYALAYQQFDKTYPVIGFPINIDQIQYSENLCQDKIVFFHGLNREDAKGTKFIREALDRLKEKYPNDVEVIIEGHMPFDQYIKVLNKTNVVVDQCCGYGYGINACLSMAQGKVVISGCRKETIEAFHLEETPMILAKPDSDFLFYQMENIVLHKEQIPIIGKESRLYVEKIHNYKHVAQAYIDAWKSTNLV